MFKILILLAFGIVACTADHPESVKVYCGEIPDDLFSCLGNPKIVAQDVSTKCDKSISECDKVKCIFKESNWLTDDKVDKKKVSEYFDQFAKDHPDWSLAVEHLKPACLDQELLPQGVDISCPVYDVMHCILTSFIRNTAPTQWSSSSGCKNSRQFARVCPVCPGNCFAPVVPNGSCNSCSTLPRGPLIP